MGLCSFCHPSLGVAAKKGNPSLSDLREHDIGITRAQASILVCYQVGGVGMMQKDHWWSFSDALLC